MEVMELGTDHVPMIVSGIRVQDIFIGQQSVEHIVDAFTLLIGKSDIEFHDDASFLTMNLLQAVWTDSVRNLIAAKMAGAMKMDRTRSCVSKNGGSD